MAIAATRQPGEAALLIQAGGQQRRIEISNSPFTIGRAEECDATIADFKVSRQHAKVVSENGEYFIVDTESRHGTFVNGEKVLKQLRVKMWQKCGRSRRDSIPSTLGKNDSYRALICRR